MDLPFLSLAASFALSVANVGGALAYATLAQDQPAYRGRGWIGVGGLTLLGVGAAALALANPAFDVEAPALIAAVGLAGAAALAGLRTGPAWATGRGVLWLAAAGAQAYALVQAIGLA